MVPIFWLLLKGKGKLNWIPSVLKKGEVLRKRKSTSVLLFMSIEFPALPRSGVPMGWSPTYLSESEPGPSDFVLSPSRVFKRNDWALCRGGPARKPKRIRLYLEWERPAKVRVFQIDRTVNITERKSLMKMFLKQKESSMEPHGQSPWFPRDVHKGRTSRTRGPIHPRVEPVVLLVRDRVTVRRFKRQGVTAYPLS